MRWGAKPSRLALFAHAGFVLTGMFTTLLGPVLPVLALRWSLNDARTGYFFTAEFLGSIVGVGISSLLVPRLGFCVSLAISYLLLAAGVSALGIGPWAVGLSAIALYGLGLGITIPATNLWVAEMSGPRRAAALNVLNFAWGLGAITFPAIAAVAVRTDRLRFMFLALAGAALVITVVLFSGKREGAQRPKPLEVSVASMWRVGAALSVLFYLYVGAENAMAGWIAMYTDRLHFTTGTSWAAMPSIFWGALLFGRAAAVPVLRRWTELKLLYSGLALAAVGAALVIAAETLSGIVVGTAVAGLGMAAVFPLLVARLSYCFGESSARAAGPIFAFGGLGGASLPWIVGLVSQLAGDLRVAFGVPLAALLLMIAVLLLTSSEQLGLS